MRIQWLWCGVPYPSKRGDDSHTHCNDGSEANDSCERLETKLHQSEDWNEGRMRGGNRDESIQSFRYSHPLRQPSILRSKWRYRILRPVGDRTWWGIIDIIHFLVIDRSVGGLSIGAPVLTLEPFYETYQVPIRYHSVVHHPPFNNPYPSSILWMFPERLEKRWEYRSWVGIIAV